VSKEVTHDEVPATPSSPEKIEEVEKPKPPAPPPPAPEEKAEELPTLMKEYQKEKPNERAKYIVDTSEKPQDKGEVNELIYKE